MKINEEVTSSARLEQSSRKARTAGHFIRRMQLSDLPQVIEIERASFPSSWSFTFFEQELRYDQLAHYFVACRRKGQKEDDEILGYVGLRVLAGEAHLTTIAVKESERRRGVGESLLIWAIEFAQQAGASLLTLEVRASNLPAQSLYRKYGFVEVGIRRRYYIETGEDALLMSLEELDSADFWQQVAQRTRAQTQPSAKPR